MTGRLQHAIGAQNVEKYPKADVVSDFSKVRQENVGRAWSFEIRLENF
jgi:hypothetical protein